MPSSPRRALVPIVAALAACVLDVGVAAAGQPAPELLLPDLDQQTPNALTLARSDRGALPQFSLGFQSAVRNIGLGPLAIVGRRGSTRTPFMTTRQRVQTSTGTWSSVSTPGLMRFAVSPGHRHWHLLRFDRYVLRRAGAEGDVVRDSKTGFCLGDRYRVDSREIPAAPPSPRYTTSCGLNSPGLRTVRVGISPGYGDNYLPYLEGQSLPITGLEPGRYVLIHRVNEHRDLRELDYANNSASLLLDLSWRDGAPSVTVIASCPDTDRCDEASAPASAAQPRATAVPSAGAGPRAIWPAG